MTAAVTPEGPFVCTKLTPWHKDTSKRRVRVVHPDATEVGDQQDGYPGGDIVTYRCPNCGHSWNAELPQ